MPSTSGGGPPLSIRDEMALACLAGRDRSESPYRGRFGRGGRIVQRGTAPVDSIGVVQSAQQRAMQPLLHPCRLPSRSRDQEVMPDPHPISAGFKDRPKGIGDKGLCLTPLTMRRSGIST